MRFVLKSERERYGRFLAARFRARVRALVGPRGGPPERVVRGHLIRHASNAFTGASTLDLDFESIFVPRRPLLRS